MMNNDIWFFSTEQYAKELPVRCSFVKQLITKNTNKEAVLIKAEVYVSCYKTTYLVLVPKHKEYNILNMTENVIFVYVINGEEYKNRENIDLSAGNSIILDWGGVTFRKEQAYLWQCKEVSNIEWK